MMQNKSVLYILLLGILTIFSSCQNDIVYSRFYPLKSAEWPIDSILSFDYSIEDTEAAYTTIVYIRHTERYPYQNMWLFVENGGRKDTIEFYLADDRGQWLGDKHSGFIEMPVLLEENYQYSDTGIYHLSIQQAMRDTLLRGVTDIGVEIHSNK